ncbi:CLUMA_CG000846, isoform A [Clunio marinus]|uniref:Proteasomal ubiquitin receptor ADRM1 homolog n=1 Tax=Clunio marinus TaxID=568069 RepID=A0A1J1HGI8_9DIPT|nr:CLUMA_CG000846, isoform A [Clunio marinus]
MSIFGQAASSLGSTSGNRHSIEFKAGRMNLVDREEGGVKKKMVHPDNRKGLLYIYSADDGLTHFCWKDRTSGNVEDDLIIFPDDCEFKKVEQCKDGRVFLLRFKSSNRKLFFWLQEPTNDKDDEYCRRVNELLNNPPSSGGGSSGSGGNREGSDLQYMLNNMSQQQLMQLFGGVGQMGGLSSLLGSINRNSSGGRNTSSTPSSVTRTSTTTSGEAVVATPVNTTQPATPKAPRKEKSTDETTEVSTPAVGSGSSGGSSTDASRVLLSELQSYLAGMNTGGASGSKHNVDLSTSLNSESINSILSDPERLQALQAHLPSIDEEGKPLDPNAVKQQLKDTLASPQFQQALSMFSNALQSGQLGPVVSQFKLSDDAVSAANSGDLEQFVKALEKASIKDTTTKDDEKGDKKDETKN